MLQGKRKHFHNIKEPYVIFTEYEGIRRTHFYWGYKGYKYSFEEWCKKTKKTDEEIAMLKLKYGKV